VIFKSFYYQTVRKKNPAAAYHHIAPMPLLVDNSRRGNDKPFPEPREGFSSFVPQDTQNTGRNLIQDDAGIRTLDKFKYRIAHGLSEWLDSVW